ncbi:hypothetical protein PDJAM_G00248390 [Pangasius djambal]|uniref:Uncharacterized protein n=1 Tax=Pangasius djambal TaxID=1691987 RepID=A0ACC5YJ23_9TELE|nr:hypothetical protein [Pangasius djambal]
MTSVFSICIVLGTMCVSLLSAEAEISVPGQVGSTAVLPCELQPVGTETPHIRWRIKSEDVFERVGEDTYRAEGYKGRVDVPEEELLKGNCSLVLQNLTLTDAGVYTSYQIVRRSKRSVKTKREEISRVKLSVQGLHCAEAEIFVSGQVGSPAVLPCELQPVGTKTPYIRWRIESEVVFERLGEESYQAEGYEGRVDVPEEELRKGNCSLVLQNLTLTDAGVYTSYQIVRRSKRSASVMTTTEEISHVKLSVQGK